MHQQGVHHEHPDSMAWVLPELSKDPLDDHSHSLALGVDQLADKFHEGLGRRDLAVVVDRNSVADIPRVEEGNFHAERCSHDDAHKGPVPVNFRCRDSFYAHQGFVEAECPDASEAVLERVIAFAWPSVGSSPRGVVVVAENCHCSGSHHTESDHWL